MSSGAAIPRMLPGCCQGAAESAGGWCSGVLRKVDGEVGGTLFAQPVVPVIDSAIDTLAPFPLPPSSQSDTMAIHYPRYSEELPTQQQEDMALAALKQTGQPSEG